MSLMTVTKGKIYRMSQERQRASFALVLVFMAVFGMIVLAEVLNITIDTNRHAHYLSFRSVFPLKVESLLFTKPEVCRYVLDVM